MAFAMRQFLGSAVQASQMKGFSRGISQVLEWLKSNAEWFLSGIGVVLIGAIVSLLKGWLSGRHRVNVLMH